MIPKTRNRLMVNRTTRLLVEYLCGTCTMIGLCAQPAMGQNAEASQTLSSPQIGRSEFQRVSGPIRKEGISGALDKCGSYARGGVMARETYALGDGTITSASVEVVTHAKGYRYAAHDLFGSLLRVAAYDAKESRRGEFAAAAHKVRCMEWEYADETKGGIVCCAEVKGDRGPEGVIAWLKGNPADGVVTVRIAYRHPKALLPGQVIDKYLREYPSDVPDSPTWHHDWETKDIEKWRDVLQTHKGDTLMLQAGAMYLMNYDRRAFGLLDALKKRDNPTAFTKALKGVDEKIGRWVEERKKTKEPGQRGE